MAVVIAWAVVAGCGSDTEVTPPPDDEATPSSNATTFCALPSEVHAALWSPLGAVPKDLVEAWSAVPKLREDFTEAAAASPDEVRPHVDAAVEFISRVDEGLQAAETPDEANAVAESMVEDGIEYQHDHGGPLIEYMSKHCDPVRSEPGQ